MEIEEHNDVSSGGLLLPVLHQIVWQDLDSFTSIVGLNNHGRKLDFKMLNHLQVNRCNQLKYLFPLYVLKDLQLLKNIDISDCAQLEHVFVDEKQDTQTNYSNIIEALPFLHSLKLSNLPQLASICSGACHVTSRSLTEMTVEECPKFIFTFVYNPRSIEEQELSENKNPKEMIVMPSKLENLSLCEVDHLVKMYKDPWVTFMCLTSLQLRNCNKLKYLFSLSMAQNLFCLQELKIISCKSVEQIVRRETDEREGEYNVGFPHVKTLILEHLPNFTGSYNDNSVSVKWLALANVKVVECPKIQRSMLGMVDRPLLNDVFVENCPTWEDENLERNIGHLFKLTDELSQIEHLVIKDFKELKKYMEMKLQKSSFINLRILEARECDEELSNFLSILLHQSYELKDLIVENCKPLEQVFDLTKFEVEGSGRLKFPKLHTMQLCSLPDLKCIWNINDPWRIVELGKLVKLEIIRCGLPKSPLSTAILEELVLLEELKIESCAKIEQVAEDDTKIQERSFLNLKVLHLASLQELIKFNSGRWNFKFPNLQSLTIERCSKLKIISNQTPTNEGTSDQVSLNKMTHPCPKLQTLKLANLEMLEDISHGQYSRVPLCDLEVMEVDSFSRLEHMWIARSEKLKKLVVRNCKSLGSLVLPSNCVNLTELRISDCIILKEIYTDPEQEKINETTFSQLGYIVLENLSMLSFFSLETSEFPSLEKLRIVNCPMLDTLPKNVSDKANKSLDKHSASLVLFDCIKEDSPAGEGKMQIPFQLKSLELTDLPNMLLWKQEPEIPVFQNLTSLKIRRCSRIENLFSISVAQHFSVLKWLTLYRCENMVQVLAGGGGNSKQVFKKLETLVLKHLPKLTSFSEEDVEFGEFPELKMVRVENVPEMKTFVKRSLKTPNLKKIHVTHITKCWQEDLNQTIAFLHQIHRNLEDEVWESDQNSTRHDTDTAESSSEGKLEI